MILLPPGTDVLCVSVTVYCVLCAFSEKQKKRQMEQVEDGMEELRERLRLSQAALDTEREADALRKNQVGPELFPV